MKNIGTTRDTSGECSIKAEGNAGEYNEGLCWTCTREQYDFGVQVRNKKDEEFDEKSN